MTRLLTKMATIGALLIGAVGCAATTTTRTPDEFGNVADVMGDVEALVTLPACPGPFPTPIAFSVSDGMRGYGGGEQQTQFPNVIINEGGGWTSNSFVAPCAGLYYLSIHAVADARYAGVCQLSTVGTLDDVYMYLKLSQGGGPLVFIQDIIPNGAIDPGARAGAWSGEITENFGEMWDRRQASYSVVLRLEAQDRIVVFNNDDDPNKGRCFARTSFNGHRIGD